MLRAEWGKARLVEHKGVIDLVTDADKRSEEAIVASLLSRFPDHQVLAEEGTRRGSSSSYRWIIDPLDGTTNYAHGYPHFAVSIGLELDGEVIVGAVFDPMLDEMFVAQTGMGATLNGRPLQVSHVDRLVDGLLCTGFPYDRGFFPRSLRRWNHFVMQAQGVRRDGSAALDICYVAAGRFDAFWEDHLFPWDAAAGVLMVVEAGGTVSDFDGGPPDLFKGDLVASNGHLHRAMLAGLAASDPADGEVVAPGGDSP